jgi:uncharacterized protein (DUF1330 family)
LVITPAVDLGKATAFLKVIKMSCYFIAHISINDPETYQKYLDGFDEVFKNYQGQVIMVDDEPSVLEGEWNHTRIVMIRFPDETEARRWYESPEYQELVQYRWQAADADIILTKGRT